jgi:hypothetical protein
MSTRITAYAAFATGLIIGWAIEPSIVHWLSGAFGIPLVSLGSTDFLSARLQFALGAALLFTVAPLAAAWSHPQRSLSRTALFLCLGCAVSSMFAWYHHAMFVGLGTTMRSSSPTSSTFLSIQTLPMLGIPLVGVLVIAILAIGVRFWSGTRIKAASP